MARDLRGWWRRGRQPAPASTTPVALESITPDAVTPPDAAPSDTARAASSDTPRAAPSDMATSTLDPAAPEVLDRLADYVRVQVRSGVHDIDALRTLVVEAAETEIRDPSSADEVARELLSEELGRWRSDAATWIGRTDPERLDRALERLGHRGVMILPAIESTDVLAETVRIRGCPQGAVAYLIADIWFAVDNGELPLRVIDADGAPAARANPLVAEVMDILAEEGLLAVAGRHAASEPNAAALVTLSWRRRPSS